MFRKTIAQIAGHGLVLFIRMVTAPRAVWAGIEPIPRQRVYFSNHTSNADFPLVWAVLPTFLRSKTRPVAASDYWLKNRLRDPEEDPVARMIAAVDGGASLIIFPEGKRNLTEDPLLPFKTGLYHLARARPQVDLVPTWIDNLNSVLPKGEIVPVPLICTVTFGPPIHIAPGEDRDIFLDRAHRALSALNKAGDT